jgi:hypothetical protein
VSLDTNLPQLPDASHPIARDRENGAVQVVDADWYPVLKAMFDLLVEIKAEVLATSTVAAIGSASPAGRLKYVSNGRKVGEGVGAGTGTLAYSDSVAWRRVADDSTVAA